MGHPALDIPAREKGHERPPIFIHSLIDDLGLSLEAFRVYSHLARRWGNGTHDSVGSYSKLGEHCFRASFPCASKETLKRKAIAAIKELEESGLIEKHKHQGNDGRDISNSYTLRTREELSNIIPFPHPSRATHPPVKYRPIEGPTAKGSTTKGTHRAGEESEENQIANVKPTPTENRNSTHPPQKSSTVNGSDQTKCSAQVEEKINSGSSNKPQKNVADWEPPREVKDLIGRAPFESVSEMNEFKQALTEFAKASGKRYPGGFTKSILNEMRTTGYRHPYWQEWKNGSAIGTHETQEWEAVPGQPYPYFLEWLAEQFRCNEYSQAQALQQANRICSNPQHAQPHWEKFKLKLQREAEESSNCQQSGITYVSPAWMRQPQVTQQEAITAVEQIQQICPKQESSQPDQMFEASDQNSDQNLENDQSWLNQVQNWLADIETKWSGIHRSLTERFFRTAIAFGKWRSHIAHSTPEEQIEIYKLLLNHPTTKQWMQTVIEQESSYDF